MIEIVVFDQNAVAMPLTFQKIPPHSLIGEPTMCVRPDVAQQLMDELWRCGLRPSEGTGSAGALAAVERHLKDMQRLVFGDGNPIPIRDSKVK